MIILRASGEKFKGAICNINTNYSTRLHPYSHDCASVGKKLDKFTLNNFTQF